MRVDVVSIFPAYLAPLRLSLPGRAIEAGLLDLGVHDLRDWAYDRHRTVDDTPYGGGAGMVMRPEPWGAALDALLSDGSVLLVPTPSGRPFDQSLAIDLADADHLVFACGRYEGIDQRVLEHAATRVRVEEVSLGDYVLNGGEVAALAVIEAVVRLLPGFMGNPESLAEESHTEGLLEYPVYTRPATWRGLTVPEVLLSGDHARIATWRRAQALARTAQRRPDLAHPARTVASGETADAVLRPATAADHGEILTLQWAVGGQRLQSEELSLSGGDRITFVLRGGGRLLGTVRAGGEGQATWTLDLLLVVPDLPGEEPRRLLVRHAEQAAPAGVTEYRLEVPPGLDARLLRPLGYRRVEDTADGRPVARRRSDAARR